MVQPMIAFFKRIIHFFSNITIEKFDRGLMITVIGIHVLSLVEFIKLELYHLLPETILAVSYIILITGFWLWFMKKKFGEERLKNLEEINTIKTKNEELIKINSNLKKYERYSRAYKEISYAYAQIHDLQRMIRASNPESERSEDLLESMLIQLQVFCDFLVDAFEKINDKKDSISVCIKIIVGSQNKVNEHSVVRTLLRDKRATMERSKDKDVKYPINENTAFLSVLKKIEKQHSDRCFYSNELPYEPGYKNSSKQLWEQEEYSDNLPNEEKLIKWKLPYKSAIVTGIFPATNKKSERYLTGFICIDSPELGIFDPIVDIKIFNGIADGLFNTFRDFKDFNKRCTDYHKKKINTNPN